MGDVVSFTEAATARDSRRQRNTMKMLKSAAIIAAGFAVVLAVDSVSGGMISKSLRGVVGA